MVEKGCKCVRNKSKTKRQNHRKRTQHLCMLQSELGSSLAQHESPCSPTRKRDGDLQERSVLRGYQQFFSLAYDTLDPMVKGSNFKSNMAAFGTVTIDIEVMKGALKAILPGPWFITASFSGVKSNHQVPIST